jgi:hypothetical protein
MTRHKCANPSCPTLIPPNRVFCGRHLRRIPRPAQRRLYAAWNQGEPSPDYEPALAAAIAYSEHTP